MSLDSLFEFQNPGVLRDGELSVVLTATRQADGVDIEVPTYFFGMVVPGADGIIGHVNLRIGTTPNLVLYQGQIGYGVQKQWRGHHYAARATRLLLPLARCHELTPLWITTDPDNWPSRRTCEMLGCVLVELLDVPAGTLAYRHGARRKCRYRLDL